MIPIPIGPNADNLPEETPVALREITTRLERSISEFFSESATVAVPTTDTEGDSQPEIHRGYELSGELDRRLYLPRLEGWQVRVKSGPNVYCGLKNPGQDWFHLIVDGELYLEFDCEKLCLNCALRCRVLTDDRLFWQSGARGRRASPITDKAGDHQDVGSSPLTSGEESTGSLE